MVKTGNVTATVTSSGTLVPASQVNLGFRSAGQLAELDVKVGDQVEAGQVLARLDSRAHQIALQQAQGTLQQAQGTLATAKNGSTLTQAQDAATAAQSAYNDAVSATNTTNQQEANPVAADQQPLQRDQAAAAAAQAQVTALRAPLSRAISVPCRRPRASTRPTAARPTRRRRRAPPTRAT